MTAHPAGSRRPPAGGWPPAWWPLGLHSPLVPVPWEAEVAGIRDDVAVLARPAEQLRLLEERQGDHVLPQDAVDLVVERGGLCGVGSGQRLVKEAVHLRVGVVIPVLAAQSGAGVGAVDALVARGERRADPGELDDVELALRADGAEQR